MGTVWFLFLVPCAVCCELNVTSLSASSYISIHIQQKACQKTQWFRDDTWYSDPYIPTLCISVDSKLEQVAKPVSKKSTHICRPSERLSSFPSSLHVTHSYHNTSTHTQLELDHWHRPTIEQTLTKVRAQALTRHIKSRFHINRFDRYISYITSK